MITSRSPTRRSAIVANLVGRQQPEFTSMAQHFWERQRDDVAPIFARARERGELPPDTDIDVLFALVARSLYVRTIVMAQPIDEAWIDNVLTPIMPATM